MMQSLRKVSLSLTQPTISPLFKTRQAQDSFLTWTGNKQEYYNFLRKNWEDNQFSGQEPTFDIFWDKTLHNGVFTYKVEISDLSIQDVDLSASASRINKNYKPNNNGLEVVFYQKVSIGTGYHANNPWLQELPDPISKATWDNYATISQKNGK